MKQKIYYFLTFVLLYSVPSKLFSQNQAYWKESFTLSSSVTSDPGANSTVYNYTGDAGTWTFYGVYTTTGTDCPAAGQDVGTNRHIRSTNSATLGSGTTTIEDDTAYIITPSVLSGVQEVHINRSRNNRRITIWKSSDNLPTTSNWILASVIPKATTTGTCIDTAIIINDATAKQIRFRFERATNSDVDSIWVTSVGQISLPVIFESVKAYRKNNGVQVEWISATEINVNKYAVEKSVDGQNFNEVASVNAKGNSTTATSYSWYDASPNNGNNYYRIKGIDKDGSIKYTSIMRVVTGNELQGISISPNPVVGNRLTLRVNNVEKGNYSLNIYSTSGAKVFTQQLKVESGSFSQTVQLPSAVKEGMYSVELTNNVERFSKSVIVK